MKKIILIVICTGVLFPCTNFSLDFLQQVELNNIVKVREMVNQGADVNQSDKLGFTALHISSWNGYIELTKYLLDLGANPNVTSPSGYTPLAFANPAIKDLLIRYGAYTSLGPPPPTLIIREPVVISNTPSTNIVKLPAETPQPAIVLPIVSNFISNSITNIVQNNTVLYPKTSYSILKNIAPDESTLLHRWDRNGINALHRAAKEGSYQEVTNLVAKGINPLGTDNNNNTPLHFAVQSGVKEIIKYFVEEIGNDVNKKNTLGTSPFILAAKIQKPDILKYMIQMGGNVNMSTTSLDIRFTSERVDFQKNSADDWTPDGWTPLMAAAEVGDTESMTILLEAQASLNITDNNGYNALMYAIKSGNLVAVKFLVDQGIDVYASVSGGAAALAFARKQNSQEIISYLQSLGLTDTPQPTTNEANETDTTDMDEESTETTPTTT